MASAALGLRRHQGGDVIRLVMAETIAPWLRAFCYSRWTVAGDGEQFAIARRQWVEGLLPMEGIMHVPQPPSVPPIRAATLAVAVAKAVPKEAPKPPPPKKGPQRAVWQLL